MTDIQTERSLQQRPRSRPVRPGGRQNALGKVDPATLVAREFMGRNVRTIYSHSNVRNAIKMMSDNNIGSVVVIDSSGPRGVFTERDLLSKVLAKHRDTENTLMMEVLSPLFVSVGAETTLLEAAKTMVLRKSRLMVFDGGDLEGIVTATDIVRCVQRLGRPLNLAKVITKNVVTELPETPVSTVVQEMDEKHIGSVLVAEEDEEPYGIFTERDLLVKVLAKKVNPEAAVGEFVSVPMTTASVEVDGVEAAKIMASKHIKRLPLRKRNEIVGIVTARDIVEAFATSNYIMAG